MNDDIPPENITGLSVEQSSETIVLNWTNPTDSDFSNAENFISSNDKDNPYTHTYSAGKGAALYKITDLYNNTNYEISIRAVDYSGNRSNGVSIKAVPNNFYGPAEVKNLLVSLGEGEATLTWCNPRDVKFSGVEITVINNDIVKTATSSAIVESARKSVV